MTGPANPDTIYTLYPVLRSAMSEDFDGVDDAAFAETVEQVFEGWSADELEINFSQLGRSLSRGLGQVGNVAARAAPGALSGAVQGASMGAALGPYGMLAGAALGAVGGGISSYNQSRRPSRPAQPQTARRPSPSRPAPRQPAYAPAPGPHTPQTRPGAAGQQAMTAQLLQLLSRPEVIQALLALSAGSMGRTSIPVGTTRMAPEDIVEVIGFTLRGGQVGYEASAEGYGMEPGAEVLNALASTPPDNHPFEQTLAMISDGVERENASAPYDQLDKSQEYESSQDQSSYSSLSPEYV